MGVVSSLKHAAYNVFLANRPAGRPTTSVPNADYGQSYGQRPDQIRVGMSNERSIVAAMYMRLAIDCAAVDIRHVMLDELGRYTKDIESGLHNCLNVEANIDQTGVAFLYDLYMSMFEIGDIAAVPVVSSSSPANGSLADVLDMRIGRVVQWYPKHVKVSLYNDETGRREDVVVNKRECAVVVNPLYAVMNEPNSTLNRLQRKLALLDFVDEQSSSGKLDMVIQMPYPMHSATRRVDNMNRKQEIEFQLKNSHLGIAYLGSDEKVTQLNRPVENGLLKQVEYLREMLYTELGLTPAVMNGTATEAEMLNYMNRTTLPTIRAVTAEFRRKFLTKTARTQGHDIMFFRDPFQLVPMAQLAELADKFTRNEILSSNEIRGIIGMRPVLDDPKADMLINSNLTVEQSQLQNQLVAQKAGGEDIVDADIVEDDPFAGLNEVITGIFKEIGVDE